MNIFSFVTNRLVRHPSSTVPNLGRGWLLNFACLTVTASIIFFSSLPSYSKETTLETLSLHCKQDKKKEDVIRVKGFVKNISDSTLHIQATVLYKDSGQEVGEERPLRIDYSELVPGDATSFKGKHKGLSEVKSCHIMIASKGSLLLEARREIEKK